MSTRDQLNANAVKAALAHPQLTMLVDRLSRRQPVEAAPWPGARHASVAAVLRVRDEPELLFIKRADALGDPWSGHIAFPGGRSEAADASLEATAVRETHEEIALDLRAGRIVGQLDDLAPRTRALPPIIVRPFVAVVSPDVMLVASREVAETFWAPLSTLVAPSSQIEHTLTANGATSRFPAYGVNGYVVWGLTERIVRQLLELCTP